MQYGHYRVLNRDMELKSLETTIWRLIGSKPNKKRGNIKKKDTITFSFFRSDGIQPHFVNIQFPKRTAIERIDLYVDIHQDESYTPTKISFRFATTFHDLQEVKVIDLDELSGWICVPLNHPKK